MAPLCPNTISPKWPKPFSVELFPVRFWYSNRFSNKKWSVSNSMPRASCHVKTESKLTQHLVKSIAKGFVGFAATATALASICCDSPALAESLTVAFPVSRAPEVIVWSFLLTVMRSASLIILVFRWLSYAIIVLVFFFFPYFMI